MPLFSDEDEPFLKIWLENKLAKLSDAEAPILAEYCLALLKHEEVEDVVRAMCIEQLSDFLRGETSSFVSEAFDIIHSRSYIPNNRSIPIDRNSFIPTSINVVSDYTAEIAASDNGLRNLSSDIDSRSLAPNSQNPKTPASEHKSKKRKHCFAFQNSGFCRRGPRCPYEHSSSSFKATPSRNLHEYDPTFSAMYPEPQSLPKLSHREYPRLDQRQIQASAPVISAPITSVPVEHTSACLNLEHIPLNQCVEHLVRREFEVFGNIVHIDLDTERGRARLTYTDSDCVEAAISCPRPFFQNRFVKLYRQRENVKARTHSARESGVIVDVQRLASMQRTHEQRLQKLQEMEQRSKLLAAQQSELQRRQDEHRRLLEQLESSNNLEQHSSQPSAAHGTRVALQMQLESLKQKAASLGVIPGDCSPMLRGNPSATRGKARNSSSRAHPYKSATRSLDNRTRTLQLEVDSDVTDQLAEHIRNEMEHEHLQKTHDNQVQVTFKTRRDAEKFSCMKVIGGIIGAKMAWVYPETAQQSIQDQETVSRFERYDS